MSVYFAKVGRYIKVGFSDNPERRVRNLWKSATRYGRPWDLSVTEVPELLLAVDGDLHAELWCHRALEDYAAGCEWFIDEPGVREFMKKAGDYIARDKTPFPKVERPDGEFIPVPAEQMLPERVEEIDRMVARARAKRAAA